MRVMIVLFAALMLGGCAALMVGGAAVGGYQLGKDERPAGVVASDSAITTKIKGKYVADTIVSVFNIGVRTWEGTVTLSGTVGSYVAREQAESIAKGTNGVKAVNNHIVVEDRSAAN
ncbi:MAG: BON domain-containing protein [Woeseiaceae bacterium]